MRVFLLALLVGLAAAKGVEDPKLNGHPKYNQHRASSYADKRNPHAAHIGHGIKARPNAENECEEYPCMVFEDNFDSLNFNNWDHEITAGGGGNWEFEFYTNNRSNSYTRDGILYIRPTYTDDAYYPGFVSNGVLDLWGHQPPNHCTGNAWWGCERVGTGTNYINPIQSARLRSTSSFSAHFGRVEISARMPRGDWIWPALWMLPRYNEYGDWPMSGEIDLFECRGNDDLKDGANDMGNQHGGCTLHWGAQGGGNKYEQTTGSINLEGGRSFATEFINYTMDWSSERMIFYVDGQQVLHVDPGENGFWDFGGYPGTLPDDNNPWKEGGKMAPFDRPFYFVLNVAVGGTNGFFWDGWTNGNGDKPWDNNSPTAPKDFWDDFPVWSQTWNGEDVAMAIDYIRVIKTAPDA